MNDDLALRRFENLIRARSGLHMRAQEAPLLRKTLAARLQALHLEGAEAYFELLCQGDARAQREWNELFLRLTNQESYFFRDSGQLGVIRDQILPELVRRNRASRTLRIWSAGCSTGEEAYSLAMMFDDVLPFRDDWQVLILGTDISAAALERARGAIYGAWSFRALDAGLKERFFAPRGAQWEVKAHLRRGVQFSFGNLLGDDFPSRQSEIHDMDLIVCRNVFIYFGREAVAQVLPKLSATLRAGGYLVTGHAEIHDVPLGELRARVFPQTVVYQRVEATSAPISTPIVPQVSPARESQLAPLAPPLAHSLANLVTRPVTRPVVPDVSSPAAPVVGQLPLPTDQVLTRATAAIRAGRLGVAQAELGAFLEREPRHLGALCLLAQANANAGRLDEAEKLCARALEVSGFAPLPHHLLARIAEERGHSEVAKNRLKKVIYLHPASVRAYLELSAIYAREGDAARAAQMRRAALGAIGNLADQLPIPGDEWAVEAALSAGELKRQLREGIEVR